MTEWCNAISRLAAKLGVSAFAQPIEHEQNSCDSDASAVNDTLAAGADALDVAAWQEIVHQLVAISRLDQQLGEPPRRLALQDMLYSLVDIATHEPIPGRNDVEGRVPVLSAASARTVNAKHLFLAGLSEQSFPSPEFSGRLYSDEDYRLCQRNVSRAAAGPAGAEFAPLPSRSQEEMLLFYEVLTRAEKSLTLSYPALDEKAQTLPPSPYLEEIKRLMGAERVAQRSTVLQPSPLPRIESHDVPLSPVDLRLRAVADALVSNRAPLARMFAGPRAFAPADSIEAGLRILHLRGRRDAFGPADGLLVSELAAERLGRRFGRSIIGARVNGNSTRPVLLNSYFLTCLGLSHSES